MSRLASRVARLEQRQGGSGDTVVWVRVPDSWSEAQQASAARRVAQECGIQPPFDLDLWPWKGDTAELFYAGPRPDPKAIWEAIAALNTEMEEQVEQA